MIKYGMLKKLQHIYYYYYYFFFFCFTSPHPNPFVSPYTLDIKHTTICWFDNTF